MCRFSFFFLHHTYARDEEAKSDVGYKNLQEHRKVLSLFYDSVVSQKKKKRKKILMEAFSSVPLTFSLFLGVAARSLTKTLITSSFFFFSLPLGMIFLVPHLHFTDHESFLARFLFLMQI